MPLLISILRICIRLKSVNNNQNFHFDNKKNRLELRDVPCQKISEDQKFT